MHRVSFEESPRFQAKWLGFRGSSQKRIYTYDSGPISVPEALEHYQRKVRRKLAERFIALVFSAGIVAAGVVIVLSLT